MCPVNDSYCRLTVTAMCNAAGLMIAFKCQPLLDITSPTSCMLTLGCFEANATTDAGGLPKTYSSGISFLMRSAISFAAATIVQVKKPDEFLEELRQQNPEWEARRQAVLQVWLIFLVSRVQTDHFL